LTDDQKLQQFSICENLFQRTNDENLLKNAISDDEARVTKATPARSKVTQRLRSRVKPMLLFLISDALCIMN
jgi:hypothetical protein